MGEQMWPLGADPVKIRRLFPHGFTFVHARQLFESWLAQTGTSYTVDEIQALWIGFASRLCLLYHEQPPEA